MNKIPYISICIPTYKRPHLLEKLLLSLVAQRTDNEFIYSIVVVDNDADNSAEAVVNKVREKTDIEISYYIESKQNLALARNKLVSMAKGNLIAFIDDDENTDESWLLKMFEVYIKYNVDGVLGPVVPIFGLKPPKWFHNNSDVIFSRPRYRTGYKLTWTQMRTGNALLKKSILEKINGPFDAAYGPTGGSDTKLFKLLIARGYSFVWCNEAVAYEVVTAKRFSIQWIAQRSFRGGLGYVRLQLEDITGVHKILFICISVIYAICCIILLPLSILFGFRFFLRSIMKAAIGIGRIAAIVGIRYKEYKKDYNI